MAGQDSDNPIYMFMYDGDALLSYSEGLYIQHHKFNAVGAKTTVKFTEAANGQKGQYNIMFTVSDTENRYIYGTGDTQNNHVDSDAGVPNATTTNGYNWWLEEVTSLPVTITAAQVSIKNEEGKNETKCISTFYAPVALNVPAGVIACTGQVVDNYLALTAIESNVIPANTGVILLANAADTYNFAIHNEPVEAIVDNDLYGSVAKKLIAKEEGATTYYVLAKPTGKSVGFYKASWNYKGGNKINPEEDKEGDSFLNNHFKAYIPVSVADPQAAKALAFSFRGKGQGTTEIELPTANGQQPTAVYDLQGRRVLNPTKGMYIINGKKVVIR